MRGTNSSAEGGEEDARQHVSTNYARTGCTTALPTTHQLKEKHTDNTHLSTHVLKVYICSTHVMS